MRPGLLSRGHQRVVADGAWTIQVQGCGCPGLYWVASGELQLTFSDQSWSLKAGEALMLPHSTDHLISCGEGGNRYPVEDLSATTETLRWSTPQPGPSVTLGVARFEWLGASRPIPPGTAIVLPSFAGAGADWQRQVIALLDAELARGSSALADELALSLVSNAMGSPGSAITQALRQIQQAPQHPWTVAGLARKSGMSRASFAARFHKEVGQTPMVYVRQVRLQAAERLLQNPALSILEVALAVGYQNASSFRRAYRRWRGHPPGTHRKQTPGNNR